MKIAVLSPIAWRTPPRHYGPWEQMASNLTEGLISAGLEVSLFASADSLTQSRLEAVIEKGYEESHGADAKVAECLHVSTLMERAKEFDLIHNHFDFLPLTYSRLIDTPMITTIHGFSSEKIIPVFQKYNSTTHYVSISHSNRHPSLQYLDTVYNGICVENFSYHSSNGEYLLFFGRIHQDKGAYEAIQIAKKAKKKLLMAGIIQDDHYFKEKVEPFLGDDIEFLGPAGPDQRDKLLGSALALLHPIAFDEPFGLSVAEAMCCGTPVIAFNRGSMPELIENGVTGHLVSNVDEAASAVADLSKINRHDCRERVLSLFSQKKMVEDYIVLYQQILEEKPFQS